MTGATRVSYCRRMGYTLKGQYPEEIAAKPGCGRRTAGGECPHVDAITGGVALIIAA
jgi:hypothetical protein